MTKFSEAHNAAMDTGAKVAQARADFLRFVSPEMIRCINGNKARALEAFERLCEASEEDDRANARISRVLAS